MLKGAGFPKFGFYPIGFKRSISNIIQSVSWTPAELTTSLWLDASDSDTITESAGSVSQWNDKSGNDNHLTQTEAANQPLLSGSDLVFTNSNSTFIKRNNTNFSSAAIFIVASLNDVAGINGLVSSGSDNANIRRNASTESLLLPSANKDDYGHNDGDYYINGLVTNSITYGQLEIIEQMKGSLTESDFDNFFVGTNIFPSSRGWDGRINEIILLQSVPSTSDRQKIEGYLAHKWGLEYNLPSDHPYRNLAPTI